MSRRAWIGAALFAVVCALLITLASCGSAPAPVPDRALAGPTVFISTGEATGSGSYIGGEAILTAAHVVEGAKTVTVTTQDGRDLFGWVSLVDQRDDVAIVRVADPKVRSADLACRKAIKGEPITIEGNPTKLRFMTTWGRVSSTEAVEFGFWPSVVILDATAAHGVSGGPVFDAQGDILGILVGALVYPTDAAYTMAVPSSTICTLLGRKVS